MQCALSRKNKERWVLAVSNVWLYLCHTMRQERKQSCLQTGQSDWSPKHSPGAPNDPGHHRQQPGAHRHWLAAGVLHALVSARCCRAAHKMHHSYQTCCKWSWGLSLAAQIQTRPAQKGFAPIPPPLLRDWSKVVQKPGVKYNRFSQSTVISFKKKCCHNCLSETASVAGSKIAIPVWN